MRMYLFVFGLLLFSSFLHGQSTESDSLGGEPRVIVDAHYNRIFPIQTFGDNLDRNLNGFSVSGLWQMSKKELNYLGVKFMYAHIGNRSNIVGDSDIRTGSNFVNLQVNFRRFTDFYFWRVEPFFDVSFGPQLFYTQTTTVFLFDDSTSLDFDSTDLNISYGVGVGMMIHVADGFFITPKIEYNGGTAATYMVDSLDGFQFPLDNFTTQTTQTTAFNFGIGVSWSM